MNHDAIRTLYPNVVMIDDGEGAFDKDGKKIEVDEKAVEAKAMELEAQKETERQLAQAAKQSALVKLAAIGLTPEEIKHLLGV
jgi:hypothetical protein